MGDRVDPGESRLQARGVGQRERPVLEAEPVAELDECALVATGQNRSVLAVHGQLGDQPAGVAGGAVDHPRHAAEGRGRERLALLDGHGEAVGVTEVTAVEIVELGAVGWDLADSEGEGFVRLVDPRA